SPPPGLHGVAALVAKVVRHANIQNPRPAREYIHVIDLLHASTVKADSTAASRPRNDNVGRNRRHKRSRHPHTRLTHPCHSERSEDPAFPSVRVTRSVHLPVAPTKIALGNIMCTPLFPSTNCVRCKSPATLASMYASSRDKCFPVIRK